MGSSLASRPAVAHQRPRVAVRAERDGSEPTTSSTATKESSLEQDLARGIKGAANTFAPRPSTATKNPAYKGSVLFNIFEVQAWVSMVVGGLLSYNVLFPTDDPSIPRLLGMWSIWMFTVPSLRARECLPKEKDALNLLFIAIPLMNVTLPLLWKSFPFIFTANAITVLIVYYVKGVWKEVYGIPFSGEADESPQA
ncbi:hypothetical protein FOA52_000658 [Chlamydomonas sp. UWO 241]|nr:hypothetical protein FOA52_000658 [Chlamydomonas sp. UWO 241]